MNVLKYVGTENSFEAVCSEGKAFCNVEIMNFSIYASAMLPKSLCRDQAYRPEQYGSAPDA